LINQANGGPRHAGTSITPGECSVHGQPTPATPLRSVPRIARPDSGGDNLVCGRSAPTIRTATLCRNLYGQHAGEQDGVTSAQGYDMATAGFGDAANLPAVEQRNFNSSSTRWSFLDQLQFRHEVTLTAPWRQRNATGDVAHRHQLIGDTYNTETGPQRRSPSPL